jgi:DNA-directed RNA polymerase subunit omega
MPTSTELAETEVESRETPEVDSKYRLIILAAKRSKQLQRGAQPRIEIDPQKHKPTRIALEEVIRGRVNFSIKHDGRALSPAE